MVARNKIVVSGSLFGGAEEWSTGWVFADPEPPGASIITPSLLSEWADDVMAIFADGSAESSTLLNLLSSEGTIDEVRAYYYPPTGPAQGVGLSTAEPIEGTGSPLHPPQLALVFSLLTGLAGRSYRGRSYWPALTAGVTTTGMLSLSTVQGYATAMSATLSKIEDAAFPTGNPTLGVYSAALDQVTAVTTISVGTAFDTQRRRREGLSESYASAPYVG